MSLSGTLRGARNGLAAGTLLRAADSAERAWLGHVPVYAPERLATALGGRLRSLPWHPAFTGAQLRAGYTTLLGSLFVALPVPRRRRWLRAALFTVGVCLMEAVSLPALGLTPPLREWPREDLAVWPLHAFAFSACLNFLGTGDLR